MEGRTAGVSVGKGVGVSVGNGSGVGVKKAAVNVNSAITVLAAEVRTAFTSGVGSIGVAGAQAESKNIMMRGRIIFFILFPYRNNLYPY